MNLIEQALQEPPLLKRVVSMQPQTTIVPTAVSLPELKPLPTLDPEKRDFEQWQSVQYNDLGRVEQLTPADIAELSARNLDTKLAAMLKPFFCANCSYQIEWYFEALRKAEKKARK